jgi:hypothetical protein
VAAAQGEVAEEQAVGGQLAMRIQQGRHAVRWRCYIGFLSFELVGWDVRFLILSIIYNGITFKGFGLIFGSVRCMVLC